MSEPTWMGQGKGNEAQWYDYPQIGRKTVGLTYRLSVIVKYSGTII